MYYLLILLFLFFYFRLSKQPIALRAKKESTYVFIICVVLVLMAAFRSDLVGADTAGYRYDYESLKQYSSFPQLVERYTLYYMGYFATSKLFHMAGLPVQVWFGFVEAFYLFALMKFVNKFSKDKIFSLLVFATIGLFSFSLAGLKQTFAMSLMMLSFVALLEKKYLYSVLLVILTYYTHQAALVFLGVFLIYYLNNRKWLIYAAILISITIYFYGYYYMEQMVNVLENEKWEDYLVIESDYTYVTFIFLSVITIFSGINMRNYSVADKFNSRFFLACSIMTCGLQLMAGISPSLFRLAIVYMPFMMILLPNATFYSKNKNVVGPVLMAWIIFYFLYTTRTQPYSFISLF